LSRGWLVVGLSLSSSLLVSACSLIFDPQLKDFAEFGERCVQGGQCESGICGSLTGRCTRECSGSDPCGETSECREGYCFFTSPPALDGPPQISFLYLGEVEEHGMIRAHDDARQYVLSKIPSATANALSSVAISQANQVIDDEISQGSNVIIGTSSDLGDAIQGGALRHPDRNFLMYGIYLGLEEGPNLGYYMGRMYQVMYMMGALAGSVTETLHVGVVAPVANAETVRTVNAFAQGFYSEVEDPNGPSQEPNPAVVVRWINTWTDENLEQEATEELVELARTDIVLGYTESTTPLRVASKMQVDPLEPGGDFVDVKVIGYGNPDVCEAAQQHRCLSAAYWNFGTMLTRIVQEMIQGEWEPAVEWQQIQRDPDESSVYFADFDPIAVPSAVSINISALLSELATDSTAARMLPFRGPVRDTGGDTRISSRSYPSDEDLLQMCWHVDGIFQIDTDGDGPTLVAAEVPTNCRGER
jgi:basic membrane lipoprotein Med (substrate-binding protein (PBP1-ABC) superfamily)